MTDKTFVVEFRVRTAEAVATLLGAVCPEIELVRVAEDISGPARGNSKTIRYANGKRNKGITGEDAVLAALQDGVRSRDQIRAALQQHGFSPNSISPVLSNLRRAGRVIISENGNHIMLTRGDAS